MAEMTELAQADTPDLHPAESGPPANLDLIDRALDAALSLAADRPWPEISLKDIARAAGLPFAELYARVPGKPALLQRLSRRLDLAALTAVEGDDAGAAHDRLFEAVMARVEAMEPHRAVLISIGRSAGALGLAARLPLTAHALLEASGVDASGPRGAARVAALTGVWARTLQVWRDDEGALNRTMAEIDRLLKRADRRLARIGAGWTPALRD